MSYTSYKVARCLDGSGLVLYPVPFGDMAYGPERLERLYARGPFWVDPMLATAVGPFTGERPVYGQTPEAWFSPST